MKNIMPNIILEGIGGSGKTTISNFIQEIYRANSQPFIVHHFQYPKGSGNNEKFAYQWGQFDLIFDMIKSLNQVGVAVILDRSWIGEYIWSPIYRNAYPCYLESLEKDYKHLNNIILNVYADSSIILRRLLERKPNISEDDPYFKQYSKPIIAIEDIIRQFKNIIAKRDDYNIKSFNYDASSEFNEDSKTSILRMIRQNTEEFK